MRDGRPTVELLIDGHEVTAFEGETVMQAARRHEIDIPSLCYLEGLSEWGACRLCVVQVAEQPQLRPSCALRVEADMEVVTDSDRILRYRRTLLELLFAEGNHVCAVCVSNGACELQDAAVACGMDHVRFDQQAPARTVDATHPKFVFDHNRCIMCTRCVRVCDEIEGAHVWDVAGRGSDARVVVGLGSSWGTSTSCTSCGKCVAVCPTGALHDRGSAVGEMRHRPELVTRLVNAREHQLWDTPGGTDG